MSNRTTVTMLPADLPPAWRDRAALLREDAAEAQACVYERLAEQLAHGLVLPTEVL